MKMKKNPIINSDFPDIDIIRVDDTYYLVSTTMHFMPGCDILRSYDLMNWEFVGHAYDVLDETPAQKLKDQEQIYGKGMWAPSMRYYKGTFYITFTSNDMHKTFLLTATNPAGPWKKQFIEGFFYDNGLFFDEDDRVYIVHGQGVIRITELDSQLKGPKEGGLDRILVEDEKGIPLGYEGSHLYKRNGKYYLFNCHFNGRSWKTQDYFISDSLQGEFKGGCLIDDNMGYRDLGVAQGGMVDTPDGDWYAFMFQDRGALGRAPVLMPLHFENDIPVIGGFMDEANPLVSSQNHKVPYGVSIKSTRPDYQYAPINGDDDFSYEPDEAGNVSLKPFWQFNHNPVKELWSVTDRKGAFRLHSGKISPNLVLSYNTLTQRCMGPASNAWVTLDGSNLRDGDYAGISAFMGYYGAIALTREEGQYFIVMLGKPARDTSIFGDVTYEVPGTEYARIPVEDPLVTLKVDTDFSDGRDEATFYYRINREGQYTNGWTQLGVTQKLYFKMDFFTGCRFGLYYFSTKEIGGYVDFMKFRYETVEKQAFNPYLPSWEYIPDGEPYVFGDRVYIYGSHDCYNGPVFCMGDYVCWSAPVDDLGNWRYEGIIYPRTADPLNPDGKMCLYAPDVTIGADGRYYLYYVLDKVSVVSVAVCDTPAGKYDFYGYVHYKDGTRLGERAGDEPQFDPGVLTEGDITYLYTGFCHPVDDSRHGAMVTVLGPDMLTIERDPSFVVPSKAYGQGSSFEGYEFFEAPSLRKRGNLYYFIYSSVAMHELCYAVSTSPLEGFQYGGVIVSNCDMHIDSYKPANKPMVYGANNHGSMVEIDGKWYIFYHRHTNNTWYSRQGCGEEITFREDGSIVQAEITSCGLNGGPLRGRGEYPAYIACHLYTAEEAVYIGASNVPKIMQDGRDGDIEPSYVSNIQESATVGFKYFMMEDIKQIRINVRGYASGEFEVRTTWDGPVIGRIPVEYTNVWETYTADITFPNGKQALYLTYRGQGTAELLSFTLV